MNTPNEIKGMTALQSMPFYLMSRNPAVKTLKDFSDGDRIALPAVKITIQSLILAHNITRGFYNATKLLSSSG